MLGYIWVFLRVSGRAAPDNTVGKVHMGIYNSRGSGVSDLGSEFAAIALVCPLAQLRCGRAHLRPLLRATLESKQNWGHVLVFLRRNRLEACPIRRSVNSLNTHVVGTGGRDGFYTRESWRSNLPRS